MLGEEQGEGLNMVETSNPGILEYSPTIGFVLDFIILYRVEADPRRLAGPGINRVFRTDEYGILHISDQYRQHNQRELAVRRHLTRELKLHGLEMNLLDNDGEFAIPVFDDVHPNALNCMDPLHCRWSIEVAWTAGLEPHQEAEIKSDPRLKGVKWLALRLASPAVDASNLDNLDQMVKAVRLLGGYKTFVSESCEFNLHYGNGIEGFNPSGLRALAKAVWLIDPIMDTYHPEHRRDVIYPPYTRDRIGITHKNEWPASAASRSNLANHMTAADVLALLQTNSVRWGQDPWEERRLEENRHPPSLDAALAELARCGSTFSVATLMATMPPCPAYDFRDYLWRDPTGDYVQGGPQIVIRQHRSTLAWRLVVAWVHFWAVFFEHALGAATRHGPWLGGGDDVVAAAFGPLADYNRELRGSDGNPLVALPRAQGRLRQFLIWMDMEIIANLWRLPPVPVAPI